MVTVIFGVPLTVLVSCAWALAPANGRRLRTVVLVLLLTAAALFVAWWGARGHWQGAAATVAPAILLASTRLLMDAFRVVEAWRLRKDSVPPSVRGGRDARRGRRL